MDITTSRSFALYIWVLFISFMQSVNGAQFLNITSLFLLRYFFSYFALLLFFSKYFFQVFLNYSVETLLRLCNFVSNFITNQIVSCFCCCLNCFPEAIFSASVADCLAWSRSFWLYLLFKLLLIFFQWFLPISLMKYKNS